MANEKQQAQESQQVEISTEGVQPTYANLCRVTSTPEEVIMDFAVNPNAFGNVLAESLHLNHRIVMNYHAAKRVTIILTETIRRHEAAYGPIELDPRKRAKPSDSQAKK